jgi:hypothetical protein
MIKLKKKKFNNKKKELNKKKLKVKNFGDLNLQPV